jgi:ketosteroid isomerase-like protein
MAMLTSDQVMTAADELLAAFAATDTAAYFACFTPDATFVFHPEQIRLDDRAAYEKRWASWIEEGWQVESCESSDRLVQILGDAAVFTHTVDTVTSVAGVPTTLRERETIVFVRDHDRILAVHEHLSPVPAGD